MDGRAASMIIASTLRHLYMYFSNGCSMLSPGFHSHDILRYSAPGESKMTVPLKAADTAYFPSCIR